MDPISGINASHFNHESLPVAANDKDLVDMLFKDMITFCSSSDPENSTNSNALWKSMQDLVDRSQHNLTPLFKDSIEDIQFLNNINSKSGYLPSFVSDLSNAVIGIAGGYAAEDGASNPNAQHAYSVLDQGVYNAIDVATGADNYKGYREALIGLMSAFSNGIKD